MLPHVCALVCPEELTGIRVQCTHKLIMFIFDLHIKCCRDGTNVMFEVLFCIFRTNPGELQV